MPKYKIKHNKRKNTGLIYYATVQHIAEAACKDSPQVKSLTTSLVKSLAFHPIKTELDIYKAIISEFLHPTLKSEARVSSFIDTMVNEYDKLNQTELFNQRTKVLENIEKIVPVDTVLATKVSPGLYRTLSSVYVLLTSHKKKTISEAKDFVYISERLVKILMEGNQEQQMTTEPSTADKLVLNFMIKRFNKRYAELSSQQKKILGDYTIYVLGEENNREFPLKMLSVIDETCKKIETFVTKTEDKEIKEKAELAIKRTEDKEEWPTEKLVVEAMAYSELEEILND